MNLFDPSPGRDRVYGLDILRAMAILFVVYGHGCFILGKMLPPQWIALLVFDGVSIFFVLSGFLIGGILIRTMERSPLTFSVLVNFWKRRWFRTLPNYYLLLVILLVFGFFNGLTEDTLTLAKYFVFLQNMATPHPSFFPEAWSLSIEEWFYLITPILLFVAIRSGMEKRKAFLLIIVGLIVFSMSVRGYRHVAFEMQGLKGWDILLRKQIVTRLDSIMFGVLGAYLHQYHHALWIRRKNILFRLGLAILLGDRVLSLYRAELKHMISIYYNVFSFTGFAAGTLLLLPFLAELKSGRGPFVRFFTTISLISYSMYLVNLSLVKMSLIPLTIRALPVSVSGNYLTLLEYGLFWLYTLVLSVVIYRWFEVPTTRLRERF